MTAGAYETAGLRGEDHMEDRHVIMQALGDDAATSLLAVFDGHRGPETAEFAAANLVAYLRSRWREDDPAAALRDTFVALDADFREGQAREHAERVRRVGQPVAGESSRRLEVTVHYLRNVCVILSVN